MVEEHLGCICTRLSPSTNVDYNVCERKLKSDSMNVGVIWTLATLVYFMKWAFLEI